MMMFTVTISYNEKKAIHFPGSKMYKSVWNCREKAGCLLSDRP